MMEDQGYELDWNSKIENDGDELVVLPAGEYNFTVMKFERGRHTPKDGGKLPACPMAKVFIKIHGGEKGDSLVTERLFLHSKTEGLLCAFFRAIGQRKQGEPLTMDWNRVAGSTGRCKVGQRQYEGNTYNEIKGWLYPDETPAKPMQTFGGGDAF